MSKNKKITVFTHDTILIGTRIATPPDYVIKEFMKSAPPHITFEWFKDGIWLLRKIGLTFIPHSDIIQIRATTIYDKQVGRIN